MAAIVGMDALLEDLADPTLTTLGLPACARKAVGSPGAAIASPSSRSPTTADSPASLRATPASGQQRLVIFISVNWHDVDGESARSTPPREPKRRADLTRRHEARQLSLRGRRAARERQRRGVRVCAGP
jgi:hypothetical protein